MNPKIEKLEKEIEKTKTKIAEMQAKLHRGIPSGNPGEPHIRAAEEGCDSAGGISSVLSGWNAALASGDMGGR